MQVGAKILLSANMMATAAITLALPLASRAGALPLAALLTTMGLFQGSLVRPRAVSRGLAERASLSVEFTGLTQNLGQLKRLL